MPRIRWRARRIASQIKHCVSMRVSYYKLVYSTFCYNSFMSWNLVVDTLTEPMFWLVDRVAKYLGPIMVVLVVMLITSVVVIFYTCLLPHLYNNRSLLTTVTMVIAGHWLLVNIVFHYFMAAFTDPGMPLQEIPEVVSICKKCIAPKPPRTHHCSICDRCILKMDHHCPWLNNCVGHFNHRYFFLFLFYLWMGTIYVSTNGYQLFKEHFYGMKNSPTYVFATTQFFYGYAPATKHRRLQHLVSVTYEDYCKLKPEFDCVDMCWVNGTYGRYESETIGQVYDHPEGSWYHHAVLYEFLICAAVAFALGALMLWHGRLVTRGETSIEIHINKKERKRLKKRGLVFKNPYSFGVYRNWQIFLGFNSKRSFISHVIFPSAHRPVDGNGLKWKMSTYHQPSHNI